MITWRVVPLIKFSPMNRYVLITLVWGWCFVFPNAIFAQQKLEKESRLKEENIPTLAASFMDSLDIHGKTKWYLEQGLDRSSVEAKFKLDKRKYSVEFDRNGILEDVEIQIKQHELEDSINDSISFYLSNDCSKFKIRKIQIQYSGDRSTLLAKIKDGKVVAPYTVRYELVVKCRDKREVALFEYLFSDSGKKLTRSQIIFKNSSNLEY
jgi:hypothetical protein